VGINRLALSVLCRQSATLSVSDFVDFASDPAARDHARRKLIAKYFKPNEQIVLYAMLGIPVPSAVEIRNDANRQ
jgi:hypothetical protein